MIAARAALSLLAPAGPKSRLTVMIFHPCLPERPALPERSPRRDVRGADAVGQGLVQHRAAG